MPAPCWQRDSFPVGNRWWRPPACGNLWRPSPRRCPGSQGESLSLEEVERWTIPSSLIEYLSPEQQDLARSLEAYNRFVYEHYTQLPDSLRQTLEQYLLDNHLVLTVGNGFSVSDSSPLMLAQQIASTLAAQCVYTLSPPSLPEGQDFVEYFLFQSRQGYCVHFATAAVALFRAAGIPAGTRRDTRCPPARRAGWTCPTTTPTPGWRSTWAAPGGSR